MDLRCPRCGEPWDFDCLHEAAAEKERENADEGAPRRVTFDEVAADFRRRGCAALGERCNAEAVTTNPGAAGELSAAETAATLYELLGDDMDGAAAMLEDMGY